MTEQQNKLPNFIDRLLPRLVIAALSFLLVAQIVLFMDGTRQYISLTDKLEGEQIALTRPESKQEKSVQAVLEPLQRLRKGYKLTLTVVSAETKPNITVHVNNQPVGNFRNGVIQMMVYENDYLEIDATEWPQLARFRVVVDPGILLPISGVELDTRGDVAAIGRVKLK